MIMLPEISIIYSLLDIFTTFLLSSGLGLAIGQMWAEVLDKLRGRQFTYILTISILLSAYVIAERVIGEGGGPMTALCFGLMITNYGYIAKRVGVKRSLKIDKRRLREFHEEITFFVKAFFFVYIGLIVTISMNYVETGLYIVVIILMIRFAVATGVARILDFTRQERVITRLIFAQGLPAFVMSQLPFIFDRNRQYFLNPEIYPNLAVPIVLGTVLFAAIAGPVIAKKQLT
jgi:cell volume regulation protein A